MPRVLTQFTQSQLRDFEVLYQQVLDDARSSSLLPSEEAVDQNLKKLLPDPKKLERFTYAIEVLSQFSSMKQDISKVKEVIIWSAPNDRLRMQAKLFPVRPIVRP